MKIIANLYYRNNLVDSQARTIQKKTTAPCELDIHLDAAIDNTIGPQMIPRAMKSAAQRQLAAARQNYHDNPPPPIEED